MRTQRRPCTSTAAGPAPTRTRNGAIVIDAVINDFAVSADFAKTGGGSLEVVQTIPTGEQYGIAFPQDSDLLEPVNKALEEIKKDGTYAEIYEKWLGEKPEEIP